MSILIERLFYLFFCRNVCHKCLSKKIKYKTIDTLDYLICEELILCANCDSYINYWAYGCYEIPEEINFWKRANILDEMISIGGL